jgi:hypothetical protein
VVIKNQQSRREHGRTQNATVEQLHLRKERTSSRIFRKTVQLKSKAGSLTGVVESKLLDIVEGPAPSKMKEDMSKAQPSKKMMAVHLDRLVPEGTVWDERT